MSERRFHRRRRAAADGDARSLRWLWDEFAGPVSGFLRARGTPDPDEVLNDVFLAAFEGLDRFSGTEQGFRSWLFGIAHNKRVDQIRRHARRTREAPVADVEVEASATSVEDVALGVVGDRELIALLAPLTTDQRDVIVLRFISDLSLEETAAVVGKSVGAVKAIQHRAVAQLRKRFLSDPYPPKPDRAI